MPTTTPNLGLTKDGEGELYSLARVNANSDRIDTFAGEALTDVVYDTTSTPALIIKRKIAGVETPATIETPDTVPTANSKHLIPSGAVYTALSSKQDTLTAAQQAAVDSRITAEKVTQYDGTVTLEAENRAALVTLVNAGAKNLLQLRKDITSYSTGNVYARMNSDGTLFVGLTNGTTATAQLVFTLGSITNYRDRKLILSGCPSGGNYQSGYALYISNDGSTAQADTGSGATLPIITGVTSSVVALMVRSGTTISSELTFRPMVRDASFVDSTFVPYAKTNRELTVAEAEDRAALVAQVDGGAKSLFPIGVSGKTYSNVTTAIDAEGKITLNGTNQNTGSGILYQDLVTNKSTYRDTRYTLPVGKYACLASGVTGLEIQVYCHDGNTAKLLFAGSGNSDGVFEYTAALKTSYPYIAFRLGISANTSFTNTVVKPMICTAADYAISPAFVPHRPSYDELIARVEALESGSTASTQSVSPSVQLSRSDVPLAEQDELTGEAGEETQEEGEER